MFAKGITQGIFVLLATVLAVVIASLFHSKDFVDLAVGITVFAGWFIAGYFYKKRYGSILYSLLFSGRGKEYANGLIHYAMGVGLIWGPAKLFALGFPIHDVLPIFNFALLLLSIPISGASVIGALIIGGLFYKGE